MSFKNRAVSVGQTFNIGKDVTVRLVAVFGNQIIIDVECPPDLKVYESEKLTELPTDFSSSKKEHFKKLTKGLFK